MHVKLKLFQKTQGLPDRLGGLVHRATTLNAA